MKRSATILRCFRDRMIGIFHTLEQMPQLLAEYTDLKGTVRTLSRVLVRVQEAVAMDGPDSLPRKLADLHAQGEVRGQQLAAQGEQLAVQGEVVSGVAKKIESIANTQRAVMNTNPRCATFEADAAGMWTAVNRVFFKWTGLIIQDAGRWGWLDGVHWEDRARVRQVWAECVADNKRFECRFRLVHTTTGKETEVEANADPIPGYPVPCERWLGSMYEVQTGALT